MADRMLVATRKGLLTLVTEPAGDHPATIAAGAKTNNKLGLAPYRPSTTYCCRANSSEPGSPRPVRGASAGGPNG